MYNETLNGFRGKAKGHEFTVNLMCAGQYPHRPSTSAPLLIPLPPSPFYPCRPL